VSFEIFVDPLLNQTLVVVQGRGGATSLTNVGGIRFLFFAPAVCGTTIIDFFFLYLPLVYFYISHVLHTISYGLFDVCLKNNFNIHVFFHSVYYYNL
jgi:hypothetical protein